MTSEERIELLEGNLNKLTDAFSHLNHLTLSFLHKRKWVAIVSLVVASLSMTISCGLIAWYLSKPEITVSGIDVLDQDGNVRISIQATASNLGGGEIRIQNHKSGKHWEESVSIGADQIMLRRGGGPRVKIRALDGEGAITTMSASGKSLVEITSALDLRGSASNRDMDGYMPTAERAGAIIVFNSEGKKVVALETAANGAAGHISTLNAEGEELVVIGADEDGGAIRVLRDGEAYTLTSGP